VNTLARFPGASVEHLLVPGTKTTRCGKDATLANRYPALTAANSTDRRPFPRCAKCVASDHEAN
jgi:hypothetical protein